jgi:hypothetical protein
LFFRRSWPFSFAANGAARFFIERQERLVIGTASLGDIIDKHKNKKRDEHQPDENGERYDNHGASDIVRCMGGAFEYHATDILDKRKSA